MMGGLVLKVGDGSSRISVILSPKSSKCILYIKDKQWCHVDTVPETQHIHRAAKLKLSPQKRKIVSQSLLLHLWIVLWT